MDRGIEAHFTSILNDRLLQILPGMHRAREILKENSGAGPMDEADLSLNRYSLEMMMSLQGRHRQQLQDILGALRRIQRGDFGTCSLCGHNISIERLKAQPTAMVCIECKRELEAMERRKVA